MKRDMDLVRSLLLYVEDNGDPMVEDIIRIDGYDDNTTQHHITLLKQAGFVGAFEIGDCNVEVSFYQDVQLTWPGHEFLEAVRDAKVWSQTKEAAKAAGSWSLTNLAAVAVAIGKAELSRATGLEIN